MSVFNWVVDNWSLILFVLGAVLAVARELGWKKVVTVLTHAIEVADKIDSVTGEIVKSEVGKTSTPKVEKTLKPFIKKAEAKVWGEE